MRRPISTCNNDHRRLLALWGALIALGEELAPNPARIVHRLGDVDVVVDADGVQEWEDFVLHDCC